MGFIIGILTLVFGVLFLVGGLQWLGGRGRQQTVHRGSPVSGQLERIENALAALEARVDDLQAQQRFLERLVSDRSPERPRLTGGPDEESVLFDTRPGADTPDEEER
jgi:hypothetical protein